MSKWWWLILMILCWVGAGFAILGASKTVARHSSLGSRVTGRVDRIVSTAPNLTEILFALGLEDKIVGTTLDSDYPPAAANKPKIGTFWQPNIEAVIAAKPDLVITLGFDRQRNLAGRLKRIGYNTLTLNIEKISQLFEAIEKIGAATTRQYEANKLVSDIRKKLGNLADLVGTETKVRVLWIVQREPLRVAGRDTFINGMVELAGGENAIGPTVHKYPPIGAEQVIACGADVIIEPAMAQMANRKWQIADGKSQKELAAQQDKALQYWSRFKNVPAVRDGRVYVIPAGAASRLGPRLYEGVETIARCLRPELFENQSK